MNTVNPLAKGLLLIIAIQLAACNSQSPVFKKTARGALMGATVGTIVSAGEPLGTGIGWLAGGLAAQLTPKQKTLLQSLQARQVQVIEIGEQISIILPADQVFLDCSPAIQTKAHATLNNIAELLRTYPKTSVTLTGYTDSLGSSQRNVALSRQRAQAIADYLWAQDIDARLLYTDGKEIIDPGADNISTRGLKLANSIEIKFQRIPG